MNAKDKLDFPKGRYLVTGGAGFIGSYLCEALLNAECEVISADNLITGNRNNLKPMLSNPRFEFIEQDVIQPIKIDGSLAGVFHLASPASPIDYAKYPIETLRVGALGSHEVLELAKEKKCPVLVASTSEVYGDPLQHPQSEGYWGNVNPIGPRGCYDESKRYLEALSMAYYRIHGLSTRIVRIFNTYGPRMRTNDGRVVPNFCHQALNGDTLTVYGDGTQTRSFCYVDDMVEGLMRAFCADHSLPINLGNPHETRILDLANRVLELSHSKAKVAFLPLPEDDPKVRCPDIKKAKQLLAWEPKIELDEGLTKTFDYFKTQLAS